MKIKGCWSINQELPLISILIRITNPINQINIIKSALLDTAFSGYCALDSNTISTLNLPKVGGGKAFTAMGEISYENYLGIIDILTPEQTPVKRIELLYQDRQSLSNLIEPTDQSIIIQNFNLNLLGIKAIYQSDWMVLSSKNLICMVDLT